MAGNRQPDQSRLLQWLTRPAAWLCVGLILRLLYMLDQAGTSPLFYVPLLDEEEAITSAWALLEGRADAEPWFKAPGYSWLLAGVLAISGEAWPWVLRILQHTAGALLVWLAARMAGRITPAGKSRQLTIVATGFFAATYAPLIRLEENVSLDFWVVFFQSSMLFVLAGLPAIRQKSRALTTSALMAGVLAAAAWFTRPTITAIMPFMAGWILIALRLANRRWIGAARIALIFLLPTLVAAIGTATRNYIASGEALILPWQGGFNLYHANRPGATGRYLLQDQVDTTASSNPTYGISINGYRRSLTPPQRAKFDADPQFSAVDDYWKRRAFDAISSDTAAWLQLMGKKTVYLVSDKEIFNYEDFDLHRQRSVLLRILPTTFGVVFALALASLAFIRRLSPRRRAIVALLWLYAITLGGAIALYYVSGRMRMPIAFPAIVLAGHGVGMFVRFRTSIRYAAVAITLLLVGLLVSFGDWWGVRSESMAHADLARMSNAAWHRGNYEQALEFALDAEKLAPSYPLLPRLKGQALYYLGDLPQARIEFQKSVTLINDETSRNNIKVIDDELQNRSTSNQVP